MTRPARTSRSRSRRSAYGGSGARWGASRRAKLAIEHDEAFDADELEGEWFGYAALLVQVDRIVGDLSAPLPT